jgi:hypothetical protein
VVPDPNGGAWVYFQGTTDNKLWKVRDDGSQQSQIGNNTTASTPFVTPDGWVYFQGTDNKLWKVFNDGSQQSQIGPNTTASTPFVSSAGPTAFVNFLNWAENEWEWFEGRHFINPGNLINDALTTSAHGKTPCQHDYSQDVWTYNQGVILGALCDLAEITGKTSYLVTAQKIANAFIVNPVTHPGDVPNESGVDDENKILTEYTDETSSGAAQSIDQVQFKGIFVRNLARLCVKTRSGNYAAFIRRNATSAIQNMDDASHFGHRWDKCVDIADFIRQTAGVDLLNAALAVQAVPDDQSYIEPLLLDPAQRRNRDLSYLEPLLLSNT